MFGKNSKNMIRKYWGRFGNIWEFVQELIYGNMFRDLDWRHVLGIYGNMFKELDRRLVLGIYGNMFKKLDRRHVLENFGNMFKDLNWIRGMF